jgi:hypothetical protein
MPPVLLGQPQARDPMGEARNGEPGQVTIVRRRGPRDDDPGREGGMERRRLIALLGAVPLAAPLLGQGQQPASVRRVGCLTVAPLRSPVVQRLVGAFRDGLRGLGYVEGQTIGFEYRSADGRLERLRDLAAEPPMRSTMPSPA